MELQRLKSGGKRLVSDEFLSGATERLDKELYEDHIEPADRPLRLDEFDNSLDGLIGNTEQHDTQIDRLAAPKVHGTLDLTRREAADKGIWHYLTVAHRPDFVRHRWKYNSRSYMLKRFLGAGQEWDTNALSRLWWAAELTHTDGDYEMTTKVFRIQGLAQAIFDRDFGMYRPAVRACITALENDRQPVIEETARRFNKTLTTVQLESRSYDTLLPIIQEIRTDVLGDFETRSDY